MRFASVSMGRRSRIRRSPDFAANFPARCGIELEIVIIMQLYKVSAREKSC